MSGPGRRWPLAAYGGLFIASVAVASAVVRPLDAGSVGPDAAAPVIEFQRLLAGRAVEGHLTQTSKPLFDLVYGVAYSLTGDWRAVASAAVIAFGLSVVLAAILANRVAGPLSAGFAAVAFLFSPILLTDVSLAYAVTWMLLFTLLAGLAATAARPRFGLAGIALALAALARPEALAIVGTALAALVAAEILALARQRPHPPRGAYLVLLGLLAIPILAGHDWLLFGDPLFWAKTAQLNSEGRPVRGLVAMVSWIGHHFVGLAPLAPLAAAAAFVLAKRRRWVMLVGLTGAIFGVAALFVLIGARGTFLSVRYLAPIDLGVLFAAALGVSILDTPTLRRQLGPRFRRGGRGIALAVAGGALAGVAVAPLWPLDQAVRVSVADQVRLHRNARAAIAVVREALGPTASWRDLSPAEAAAVPHQVLIPRQLRAQAVVDLGLPLNAVWYSSPGLIRPSDGLPSPGTIIYHDRLDDAPQSRYAVLEIDQPTTVGKLRLVPLLSDPKKGVWVIRVEDAATP